MKITCNLEDMDIELIHSFLSYNSYWARGISLALVEKSLKHSLCFGGFLDGSQIAFARIISDYSTFANLVDVFVVPDQRGKGYGKQLIDTVIQHPELQGLRRFTLATADSHGLYNQFGFEPLARPDFFMEKYDPNIYSYSGEQ